MPVNVDGFTVKAIVEIVDEPWSITVKPECAFAEGATTLHASLIRFAQKPNGTTFLSGTNLSGLAIKFMIRRGFGLLRILEAIDDTIKEFRIGNFGLNVRRYYFFSSI